MPSATTIPPQAAPGAVRRPDQASRLRALFESPAPRAHPAPAEPGQRRAPAAVISVASGKGGVGKSNIAVNLSIALAAGGVPTTLLDADLGVANADVLCGLSPGARIDHVLARGGDLSDVAVAAPGGFRLVPGAVGLSRLAELSPTQRAWLVGAMEELEAMSRAIVIDSPAGVGSTVMAMCGAADLTLVVVTPEPTAIADAYALLKCLRAESGAWREGATVGLVVNQASGEAEARATHQRIDAVARRFLGVHVPMIGWVPADPAVPLAVRARTPFSLRTPRCPAAGGVGKLALAVGAAVGVPVREPRKRRWWW
jgi:flagellar biosynthesis protein FlhG